jgi:cytoskeletal protein CcmA (bactofilin family)
MWKPSDSTPQNDVQPPSPTPADTPHATAPTQNQYSMIGKSIAIKGEITATDPVYIYGAVEGSISAPEHRVTVGKEGRVKADITAREVVVLGDVCGNLNGSERVEIRNEGSLMGDLRTNRVFIEEGAVLQGAIDVRGPSKKERKEPQAETLSALQPASLASAEDPKADSRMWDTVAVSEVG